MEAEEYTETMLSNNTNYTKELPIDMVFNDGHLLSIIGYTTLFFIGSFGNIALLSQVYRFRKSSSITFLVLHLTIADLLVIFLLIPLEVAWAGTVSWYAGDFVCRVMSFFRTFGIYLSGFIVICISLDRVFAVFHPLSVADSLGRAKTMLKFAWFGSCFCSLPQAIIFHVEQHPEFTWYKQCVTFNFFTSRSLEMAYNIFGFTFMYGFPLIMIVACYGSILLKINQLLRSRRIEGRESVLSRAKIQTLKMTVYIVVTFFICWSPYNIMSLWYWIDKESAATVDQKIQKGFFLFVVMNSCFNPIVYGYFNSNKNRQQAQQMVTILPPRILLKGNLELISSRTHSTDGDVGNNRHFFHNERDNYRILVRWNKKNARYSSNPIAGNQI